MSDILSSVGRSVYQLAFQISPIVFTGGVATQFGGYLPIVAITETGYNLGGSASVLNIAAAAVTTLTNLATTDSLDNFFAQFSVIPGGTLANYNLGKYPFANQSVAANAIIAEPLNLAVRMAVPVNRPGGHVTKLTTMMALRSTIEKHANMGGTYTVATPANYFQNGILLRLTDISSGESPINQNTFQFDFEFPLISLQAAQAAQSNFLANVANAVPTPVPGQ